MGIPRDARNFLRPADGNARRGGGAERRRPPARHEAAGIHDATATGASAMIRDAGYLHLESGDDVLVQSHTPTGAATGTGIVLVPPFGWDDVASYRARREWADRLCRAGHEVLRLDLPSTGDSSGAADEPRFVDRCIEAVDAAARALRAQPGVLHIVVVGFGWGGLFAASAAALGNFEAMVLWGAPASGRSAVREQRALSRLQTGRDGTPNQLPEGWLEASGFVLSAETLADLAMRDTRRAGVGALQRVLVLGRTGPGTDAGPVRGLSDGGVQVEVADGSGYDAMVEHPELVRVPPAPTARIEAWLAAQRGPIIPVPSVHPPRRSEILRDQVVEERAIAVAGTNGTLAGVLTMPNATTAAPLCAIFLNAGAVRRTGPNRMWVTSARRLAALGVPSLRFDLPGIGDTDGDAHRLSTVENFYEPDRTSEVRCAIDRLVEIGLGPRFVSLGLCAGGYYSFRVATDDPRVTDAVLLNPSVLSWDACMVERLRAAKFARVRSSKSWRRLLKGEVQAAQILNSVRALPLSIGPRHRRHQRHQTSAVVAALDQIEDRCTRVTMAFSHEEPLVPVLAADGIVTGAETRWAGLRIVDLPGFDHTLRTVPAQLAALDLVDGLVGDAASRPSQEGRWTSLAAKGSR